MGGRDQRSARIACLVAFAVHALVFAMISRIPVRHRPPERAPAPPEIDVVVLDEPASDPESSPGRATLAHLGTLPRGSRGVPSRSGSNDEAHTRADAFDDTWRLGGLFREDGSAPAPEILPSRTLRDVAAAQGALSHDEAPPAQVPRPDPSAMSLSFARSNPLRAQVAEAMSEPDAPMFGTATLEFTITPQGVSLAGVRTTSSDAEWEAWARKLAKGFDATRVPIPEKRAGIRVRMYVEAVERRIDGTPPPKQGGYVRGTSFEASEASADKGGRIEFKLPTASIGYEGKKCGAGVTLGAAGLSLNGGCELAPATRQVRARVVEESIF